MKGRQLTMAVAACRLCALCAVAAAALAALSVTARSDILFQNHESGEMVNWQMNGTGRSAAIGLPATPNVDWVVVGSGDFNGDLKPDLLFQNRQTGDLAYWLMDGANVIQAGMITPSNPGAQGWRVVAVVDLNLDLKPDLVFQNAASGQLVYWIMNGTTLTRYGTMRSPDSSVWRVVGTGDFNGDLMPDLLFQNQQTGQIVCWTLNGTSVVGLINVTSPASNEWRVAGVGDFNNDLKPDILFQNRRSGDLVYWLMNGGSATTIGYISPRNAGQNFDAVAVWFNPSLFIQ